MGSGHSHAHGAVTAGGKHRWRLAVSFVLIGGFFVIELVFGLLSGSLALLSDAGHMAADVVALGAALVATRIAGRPDSTGRRTFGSYRAEVFASGLTVLLMLAASVYVAVEALGRIGQSVSVDTGPMMIVGALGLVINVIALSLLRAGAGDSLNVKGAYLEVVADTVGSVGVLVAGVLVARTGNPWWDTSIALAIAVFVAVRAVVLGREVLAVLGQHAPVGIDPQEVDGTLRSVDGVADVHDLHLWTLTSGMNVATAHLVSAPTADSDVVLQRARVLMLEQFDIEHATLQIESDGAQCHEMSW